MKITRWLALIALVVSHTALALSTMEFMKMGASEQHDVMKAQMMRFLQRGYKKVPDNPFTLGRAVEKLAYEKGYTYQNIDEVALEAAISLGMTR